MIQRLIENYSVEAKDIKKIPLDAEKASSIKEEHSLKEKVNSAYEFPIWRLDERNKNDRVYSTKIAEKAIKDDKITFALMGHPAEGDGDVKDIWAVVKNPHIKEGMLYADAYLVGDHGIKVKEILDNDGPLGLSSSSWGDLDDNGYIMLEGFEIERYCDFVMNPSYGVFGKKDDKYKEDIDPDTVDSIVKNVIDKEEGCNKNEDDVEGGPDGEDVGNEEGLLGKVVDLAKKVIGVDKNEEKPSDDDEDTDKDSNKKTKNTQEENRMLSKVEIKSLTGFIKEAQSEDNLGVKLEKLEDIHSWFDERYPADLKEEVAKLIAESKEKVKETSDEAGKVKSLTEDNTKLANESEENKSLKEKLEKATKMLDEFKTYTENFKGLYKVEKARANGKVEAADFLALANKFDELTEAYVALKEADKDAASAVKDKTDDKKKDQDAADKDADKKAADAEKDADKKDEGKDMSDNFGGKQAKPFKKGDKKEDDDEDDKKKSDSKDSDKDDKKSDDKEKDEKKKESSPSYDKSFDFGARSFRDNDLKESVKVKQATVKDQWL